MDTNRRVTCPASYSLTDPQNEFSIPGCFPYCNQCQTVRFVKMKSEFHYRVYRCTLGALSKTAGSDNWLRRVCLSALMRNNPVPTGWNVTKFATMVRLENLLRKCQVR